MIYATIGMTLLVAFFLTTLFLTHVKYRWLIWMPYLLLLPVFIRGWNKRQMTIRSTESGKKSDGAAPAGLRNVL